MPTACHVSFLLRELVPLLLPKNNVTPTLWSSSPFTYLEQISGVKTCHISGTRSYLRFSYNNRIESSSNNACRKSRHLAPIASPLSQLLNKCNYIYWQCPPAGDMTHSGKKIDQASTWISCTKEMLEESLMASMIRSGSCIRKTWPYRLHRRWCAAMKMLIPLLRINKQFTG